MWFQYSTESAGKNGGFLITPLRLMQTPHPVDAALIGM